MTQNFASWNQAVHWLRRLEHCIGPRDLFGEQLRSLGGLTDGVRRFRDSQVGFPS